MSGRIRYALCLGAAFLGGIGIGGYLGSPKMVYQGDVNQDGREDLVIVDSRGGERIFLRTEDGRLVSLVSHRAEKEQGLPSGDDLQEDALQRSGLEEDMRKIKEQAGALVRGE